MGFWVKLEKVLDKYGSKKSNTFLTKTANRAESVDMGLRFAALAQFCLPVIAALVGWAQYGTGHTVFGIASTPYFVTTGAVFASAFASIGVAEVLSTVTRAFEGVVSRRSSEAWKKSVRDKEDAEKVMQQSASGAFDTKAAAQSSEKVKGLKQITTSRRRNIHIFGVDV